MAVKNIMTAMTDVAGGTKSKVSSKALSGAALILDQANKAGVDVEAALNKNILAKAVTPVVARTVASAPTKTVTGTTTKKAGATPTTKPVAPVTTPAATGSSAYMDEVLAAITGATQTVPTLGLTQQMPMPIAPQLRNLEDLASAYGIDYDYNKIYGMFNDAVQKQYDAVYDRQGVSEGKYYDNASAAQNTLTDTLARDRSAAITSGMNKGMASANTLGAMLGVSQQFADNATLLSEERSVTNKEYGAELAKAARDAEATSSERKQFLADLSRALYDAQQQQYTADTTLFGDIDTNNTARQQSNQQSVVDTNNTLSSILGNAANTYKSSEASLAGSKAVANAQVQASKINAGATAAAAAASAAAQRYAADQGLLGQQAYANGMTSSNSTGSTGTIEDILAALKSGALGTDVDIEGQYIKPTATVSNAVTQWLSKLKAGDPIAGQLIPKDILLKESPPSFWETLFK